MGRSLERTPKWDGTNLYPHQRLGSTGLDGYTTRLWEVMRSAWQATPAFVRLWHVGSVCMHVTLCALAQADPPEGLPPRWPDLEDAKFLVDIHNSELSLLCAHVVYDCACEQVF